jgi:transcriptional regulator with XRE-family HTH domain
VPGTASPTARRRELGSILRALRVEQRLTVEQAAEQLLVSASKISRLETGHRGASARDIRDLCDLYGVAGDRRQALTELAAEGKQRVWWQAVGSPYSTYIGLEAGAVSIRDFALGYIPGLLQTPDYARAILRVIYPRKQTGESEQLVRARLERQARLRGGDAPEFRALIDESVLHRLVGDATLMQDQLEALLAASELPAVTLRVVPYASGALPTGNNKFIILGFDSPAMADVVYAESLTGALILERDTDVDAYHDAYQTLEGLAASAEDSLGIIQAAIRRS